MNPPTSQHVVEFAPLDLGPVLGGGQDRTGRPHHSGRLNMSIICHFMRRSGKAYSHILRSPWYKVQRDDTSPIELLLGSSTE